MAAPVLGGADAAERILTASPSPAIANNWAGAQGR